MNKPHTEQNVKLPDDSTPIWQLTVGQFRKLVGSAPAGVDDDAPRTADEIRRLYPDASDSWLRGNVEADGRGRRQKRLYRPSKVLAAMTANPVQPRPRKCTVAAGGDPLQEMLKSGQLVRGGR